MPGISIAISISPSLTKGIEVSGKRKPEAIVSRIIQDRLQEALLRIKRIWPIATGRSFQAWQIVRVSPLKYYVLNQAASDYGEYAAFVHKKGTDKSETVLKTEIPDILQRAASEIRADVLTIKKTGKITQLPTLRETTIDRLRAAIAKKLLERTRNRK